MRIRSLLAVAITASTFAPAAYAQYNWGPAITNRDSGDTTPWGRVHFDPTDSRIVWAAKTEVPDPFATDPLPASNGIWKSMNGGKAWTQMNSGDFSPDYHVLDFAICKADPNVIYAGTLVHGVFKTEDGGSTWMQMNNGLSKGGNSFPNEAWGAGALAVDPTDPNRAFVSVGQLGGIDILSPSPNHPGFFYTLDGGANWTMNNNGLPPTSDAFLDLVSNTGVAASLVVPGNAPNTIYAGILKVEANGKVLFGGKASARILVFKNTTGGTGAWTSVSDALPILEQTNSGIGSVLRYAAGSGILTVLSLGTQHVVYASVLGFAGEVYLDGSDVSQSVSQGIYILPPGGTSWIGRNRGLPVIDNLDNREAINTSPVAVMPGDPYTILTGVLDAASAGAKATKIWATTTAGDPWLQNWNDVGLDVSPVDGFPHCNAAFIELAPDGRRVVASVLWENDFGGDSLDDGVYMLPAP